MTPDFPEEVLERCWAAFAAPPKDATWQDCMRAVLREAGVAEMVAALEPFAKEADARASLALGEDIDHWPIGGSSLRLGHLRFARAALSRYRSKTEPT